MDRIPSPLARALAGRGYVVLTPVQRTVLGVDPPTRDMLVSAQTGSGKTVAFGLGLAASLLDAEGRAPHGAAPAAVVITPTRELAQQVRAELDWLYAGTGARVVCCTGGMDMVEERVRLGAGCEIVVGSPGRLRDHVERGTLDTSGLRAVVLDEADDMLDMGFREDLEFLLHAAPPTRRTMMFSATVTPRVEALAAGYQRDAARLVAIAGSAHPHIAHEAVAIAPNDRENAIVNLLRYHDARGAIVFCARRETVAHLASRLENRGFAVVALSGALPQRERAAALAALRDGRARVCVATDLAARGLDLPGLELVIHADLPTNEAALVHRSGRTGRAGRRGRAVLVVPHPQRRRAVALLSRAGVAADWTPAPSREAVLAQDEARMWEDAALDETATAQERAAAARLVERFGAERLALAYLRSRARGLPAPEVLIGPASDTVRVSRPKVTDGVWFALNCGREGKAEVRWILPLICRLGRVTKTEIGRIVVRERETRFEISARAADAFAAAVAKATEAGVEIRRATAPEDDRPARGIWGEGRPAD